MVTLLFWKTRFKPTVICSTANNLKIPLDVECTPAFRLKSFLVKEGFFNGRKN
jgi:hypothetical protein